MGDFYENLDLKYTEIAILLEDSSMVFNATTGQWTRTPAKVTIPILMSEMYKNGPVNKTDYSNGRKINTSNYIMINIPKHLYPNPLFYLEPVARYTTKDTITADEYSSSPIVIDGTRAKHFKLPNRVTLKKGTKLLITFVEGSLSIKDIKVIGLYEEE